MRFDRTRKLLAGGALAGSLMLTGVAGLAQQPQGAQAGQGDKARTERHWGGKEGRGGRGGFGGRFFERLNLTDAQRAQMEQIAQRFHESTRALREQERQALGGQRPEAFGDGAFNESAVRAAAQARANARVEMEVARARMMHEMYNVLTAEQKAQLATERQQREQRRQEWRQRRNATQGQPTQ